MWLHGRLALLLALGSLLWCVASGVVRPAAPQLRAHSGVSDEGLQYGQLLGGSRVEWRDIVRVSSVRASGGSGAGRPVRLPPSFLALIAAAVVSVVALPWLATTGR